MSTYKIDYKGIRLNPQIAEMLDLIGQALEKFGIDYFLIGAVARDAWMIGVHKKRPKNTTGDIDFAIFINDKGVYEQLKTHLIEQCGFAASHDNAFVFIWKDKTQVDLLPFGAIEDEHRRVTVSGTGFTTVDVPGFREVYEEELPFIEVAERHLFKCCTLPGIVLLKLISWNDRPELRVHDIFDISDILHHFFDMHMEEIWQNHHELLVDAEEDTILIAARVLGREMQKIARRNDGFYARIEQILEENTAKTRSSRMAEIMVGYFSNTIEENKLVLEQLKRGFSE